MPSLVPPGKPRPPSPDREPIVVWCLYCGWRTPNPEPAAVLWVEATRCPACGGPTDGLDARLIEGYR